MAGCSATGGAGAFARLFGRCTPAPRRRPGLGLDAAPREGFAQQAFDLRIGRALLLRRQSFDLRP